MDVGITTTLSGAMANSKLIEKLANNLANADTVGYKADGLTFEESLQGANREDTRSDIPEKPFQEHEVLTKLRQDARVVLYGNEYTDFTAGNFQRTGRSLDLAIEGNGFFEVLTPNGVRLTRAGNLTLDAQGQLVTPDGFLVLGQGAATQDPKTRALRLTGTQVSVGEDGTIFSDPQTGGAPVGRLSVVSVADTKALKKVGGNLFVNEQTQVDGNNLERLPATAPLRAPKVHQGVLEKSNVNAVKTMNELMQAHRMYEQNLKLMQTVGDMNTKLSEVGRFGQ